MVFATWRLDPVSLAGVVVVLGTATAAACYLPGRRALRIDPMHVLRAE
jgi:ABC-type lipoprotein release transport system permease subunit